MNHSVRAVQRDTSSPVPRTRPPFHARRWGCSVRRAAACVAVVLGLWPLRSGAAPQSESLVDRSAAYVERFLDAYTNVVAEEAYTQERSAPRARRTLRSDVVLVRYAGSNEWRVFRDVFEVDGNLVRDPRDERLMKLFLMPAAAAVPRAQAIATAGAQHNIQDIGNLNNPLLAMSFLQRRYGERFRFTPGGRERKLGPAIREIRFEETHVPTLFRRGGNLDLPAHGIYWADEATGRIVKMELRLGGRGFQHSSMSWQPPSRITTTFGVDEGLGIDVPVEMRDHYPLDKTDIRGVATYSRFRRFEVGTAAAVP